MVAGRVVNRFVLQSSVCRLTNASIPSMLLIFPEEMFKEVVAVTAGHDESIESPTRQVP
jgi:hypothetical protein